MHLAKDWPTRSCSLRFIFMSNEKKTATSHLIKSTTMSKPNEGNSIVSSINDLLDKFNTLSANLDYKERELQISEDERRDLLLENKTLRAQNAENLTRANASEKVYILQSKRIENGIEHEGVQAFQGG
jgi:regulator of replication initiation timing